MWVIKSSQWSDKVFESKITIVFDGKSFFPSMFIGKCLRELFFIATKLSITLFQFHFTGEINCVSPEFYHEYR